MGSIYVPKHLDAVDGFGAVAREVAGDMEGIFGAGVRPGPSVSRRRWQFLSRVKRFGVVTSVMVAGTAALTVGSSLYADGGTARTPLPGTGAAVDARASRIIDGPAVAGPVAALESATATEAYRTSESAADAQSAPAAPAFEPIAADGVAPRPTKVAAAVSTAADGSGASPRTEILSPQLETRSERMRSEAATVRIISQPRPAPPVGEKIVSRLATAERKSSCTSGEPVCVAARLARADQELLEAQNRALAAGVRPGVLRSYHSEWRRARSESLHAPVDALQLYEIIISDFAILTEDAEARRVLGSR
jgi:hypothetical protein